MSVLYSTVMNLDEKEKVLHIVKKWELLNKGAYYGDAKGHKSSYSCSRIRN